MEIDGTRNERLSPVTNQAAVARKFRAPLWRDYSFRSRDGCDRYALAFFVPEITFASAIVKEMLIGRAQLLSWLLSVAANVYRLGQSARHMSLVEIDCLGIGDRDRSAGVVRRPCFLTGYGHGPGSAAFEKLPLWLITLIVLRAGVVEELFIAGTPSNACE